MWNYWNNKDSRLWTKICNFHFIRSVGRLIIVMASLHLFLAGLPSLCSTTALVGMYKDQTGTQIFHRHKVRMWKTVWSKYEWRHQSCLFINSSKYLKGSFRGSGWEPCHNANSQCPKKPCRSRSGREPDYPDENDTDEEEGESGPPQEGIGGV